MVDSASIKPAKVEPNYVEMDAIEHAKATSDDFVENYVETDSLHETVAVH